MKRLVNVLVATALMVVLMAATVSPAFAQPYGGDNGEGFKNGVALDGQDPEPGSEGWCGVGSEYKKKYCDAPGALKHA